MILLNIFMVLLSINFGFCNILRVKNLKKEIVDEWDLYLRDAYSKVSYKCWGVFLIKELFLTGPACVHSILKQHAIDKAFINKSEDESSITSIPVNLTTGSYYNENLSDGYDESTRDIMFILTNGQVAVDYDDEDFVELPKNVGDVDFSSCFLLEHGKCGPSVSPCAVQDHNNILTCNYSSHVYIEETNGAPVICHSKDHFKTPVLVGFPSQPNLLKMDATSDLMLENVSDLRDIIFRETFAVFGYYSTDRTS